MVQASMDQRARERAQHSGVTGAANAPGAAPAGTVPAVTGTLMLISGGECSGARALTDLLTLS